MSEKVHVDMTPIKEFRYCQISNHKFQYLLVDKNYRALHSPFECKDYIQDIFYTEYTGHSGEIWGMLWKQGMLDMDVEYFKLALHGGSLELEEKAPHLQKFLNTFEEALGIPESKVYGTDDPKIIVVEFNKEWTVNGPLLSAYTTLIRISGGYAGKESPMEYLKELSKYSSWEQTPPNKYPRYITPDVGNLGTSLNRFSALLKGLRPKHDWNSFNNMSRVHNTGIVGFKQFPSAPVE